MKTTRHWMRNISYKRFSENQYTLFVQGFFFFLNRAFYEKMCRNIVQPETDNNMAQAHFTLIT